MTGGVGSCASSGRWLARWGVSISVCRECVMPRGPGLSGQRVPGGSPSQHRRWFDRWLAVILLAIIAVLTASPQQLSAQTSSTRGFRSEGEPVRRIVVTLFKSRTFRLDQAFATAVIGAPEIADVMPMSDHSLYIQGKKVGTTNLTVFDQNQKLVTIFDVEVAVDTGNLQEKIQASTGSRGIRVSSSNGQVILSGQAVDAVA